MSKQEAIDFYNKGDLVGSEKKFLHIKESSTDDADIIFALEYLEKIYFRIDQSKILNVQEDLISLYFKNKEFKSVLSTYSRLNRKNLKIKKLYLETLWERKDLSSFDTAAQKMVEEILTEKIFVDSEDFFKWLKGIRKWLLYPYFGSLILALELNKYDIAIQDIDHIMNLVDNKWSKIEIKKKSQKEYYLHLLKIIGEQSHNNIELLKKKREVKFKSYLLENETQEIEKQELVDYLISFANEPEKLLWAIPFLQENEKNDLLNIIYDLKKDIKFPTESPFKSSVGKYFQKVKKVKIAKSEEGEYFPTSYSLEGIADLYDEKIFDEYYGQSNEEIEIAERQFISLIKLNGQEYEDDKVNLTVALMELGLYKAATSLIGKGENTIETKYLEIELLYRKNDFLEVVVAVNNVLEQYLLSPNERIPFYYLKAYAYLKLNKQELAQNLFSIINSFNPEFRSLKEKMLDE